MLNKIKIGPKLIGGFLIVAAIAVIVGLFGMSNMNKINTADTVLYERMTVPITYLQTISTEFQKVRVASRDVLRASTEADINKNADRINASSDSINKYCDLFGKRIVSEEMKKAFQAFTDSRKEYREQLSQISAFAKANKDADGYAVLDGAAAKAAEIEGQALEKLIDMKVEDAKNLSESNDATAKSGSTVMIVTIIVGALLALVIGIFLTVSISRPLTRGVTMMQEMAKGHLDTRLKITREDEVGILAKAMDDFAEDLQKNLVGTIVQIGAGDVSANLKPKDAEDEITPAIVDTITALRGLIAEAGMLRKAAVEGALSTRGQADKFKGGYRDIVQGVNETLDAVINPLNVAAKYVDDISKGVIPPIITDTYKGDFNTIKNNLNTVAKMMSDLLGETDIIIKAAADGELDKRADAGKFVGGWNKLVAGVNDTITAIVDPLMVTADYVDKVSKGVIPPEITTIYKGQYNIIKTNLNAVVKMMSELLKETDVIIKAAADGELDKRANAQLFVGGWNKLVSGVNDTITNIVNPLMVTADYVDKVSKGVIPPEITTIYKGQYNIIKTNLNAVVKMMSELLSETDVIIRAAADGELDKRANATLFVGGWNKLVAGVNDTITNIVNPLMVTADYVDKVSKGVIPPEITTIYKGQYNIIKTNLNAVVKMMSELLSETDKLVKAALNGQLETRANAGLFVGGWNTLVSGVNNTLEAVLGPINEAAQVLDKVAERDLTARVKGDYKGDLAKIKNSINSAVDNLDQALTQVSEATEQVSSGSQQISAGSQSLAQGANEQASSLEEVSSSLEEMASMTKQNAENANQAKSLAGEADGNAKEGAEAMSRMSQSINKIKESSDQTAKIVKTIDEIAMQTNLLALNAAVEAARAGEAGRGFAVVAEEVRNLAQRSAQAAKNTADMITESVKNADDGVKIATEVSKSFDAIAGSAKKVNDLIAEIAAASGEQSQGIDQVNNAVAQMDKVTQQNAANSEESASAAEEMSSQAEELQGMVAQFRLSSVAQRKTGPAQSAGHQTHHIAHAKPSAPEKHVAAKVDTQGHHGGGNGKASKSVHSAKAEAEAAIPMSDDVLKEF